MNEDKSNPSYRMPAEWAPHEAVWIAWPHQRDDWPGKFAAIPWVYAEIVRLLAPTEQVRILVNDAPARRRARRLLKSAGIDLSCVEFFCFPTDRVWTRDSAGSFVRGDDGGLALVDWRFNAWAKYDDWGRDDELPVRISQALQLPTRSPEQAGRRVVLEGGAIDVNGEGLLLTTEECLLSDVQQRNPGITKADYETVFADHLGVRKVLWLNRGVAGDDTHGHIDDLARFVGPRTVVAVVEEDSSDENYMPLQENLERLRGMSDFDGRPLEVVPLPMPARLTFEGRRLPASYANFYIANDRVLVPTFNDPNDRRALGVLAEQFTGRTVVGVHAVDLVWGLGTLHCLTQQQPVKDCGERSEQR
jgi:agmatine deiminase